MRAAWLPLGIHERLGDDMSELAGWDSFYIIIGSAAGALIGLQFVVMTLLADRPPTLAAGAAFATPTIVHFGAVLLLSALLHAPWQRITIAAALWGLMGFSGVAYAVIVARRMRVQTAYKPEFEDWVFHFLLPSASYAILALSAFAAPSHTHEALFGAGAAGLLLLFIGIHNAWDSVATMCLSTNAIPTKRGAETRLQKRTRCNIGVKDNVVVMTGVEGGHQTRWFAAFRQRTGRVFYRHGAH